MSAATTGWGIGLGISILILVIGIIFLIIWGSNKVKYAKYRDWGIALTIIGFIFALLCAIFLAMASKKAKAADLIHIDTDTGAVNYNPAY
jgi:hypothetical protein